MADTSARTGRKTLRFRSIANSALLVAGVGLFAPLAGLLAEPQSDTNQGGVQAIRRLNEGQYARAVEQAFGPGLKIPGRFDPPLREQGLMAIGDGKVTVTSSGVEQYELRAREIAAQAMSPDRAAKIVPCKPTATDAFDTACAQAFFRKYGLSLYRRPLADGELAAVMRLAGEAAQSNKSFAKGLEVGLSRLLVSPNFIFRIERSEPDLSRAGKARLDAWSLASRISFLLWDAPPDQELLDAAAAGDLSSAIGLGRQVDRLIASPRFEQGVRSFFADMLGYEQFSGLAKDQAIYPKFTSLLAKDAQEQALRTIVDLLVTRNGDFRDLFSTRATFMNRNLGALYGVPVSRAALDGWAPYNFPEGSNRAGLLSLAGFLMLDPTHEGRSSPTIRGKSIRELLLCQPVPMPPPNVNFNLVQDTANPLYRTARQRLTVHQENPACAGCHALTDPIGLSLENYDAVGSFRSHENGAAIDATGTFEGKSYTGLLGLSQRLRESPQVPACLVERVYEYGVGRQALGRDGPFLGDWGKQFAADGYRLPQLMRRIAMSEAFASASLPAPAKVAVSKSNERSGS